MKQTYITRRVAAFVIDFAFAAFFVVFMIFLSLGSGYVDETNFEIKKGMILMHVCVGFVLFSLRDIFNGVSIGRLALSIQVINNDGISSAHYARLILRNVFLILWPLEFVMLLLKGQRFGDKIAKTIVIMKTDQTAYLWKTLIVICIGLGLYLSGSFYSLNEMKSSDAYKAAIETIESNDKILRETEEILRYGAIPTGEMGLGEDKNIAHFDIKVYGKKQYIDVSISMRKDLREKWEMVGFLAF